MTHEIIIIGDFAVKETIQAFLEIMQLYCKIMIRIIQYLRHGEPDTDDPDGFFEVHLQPLIIRTDQNEMKHLNTPNMC